MRYKGYEYCDRCSNLMIQGGTHEPSSRVGGVGVCVICMEIDRQKVAEALYHSRYEEGGPYYSSPSGAGQT